MISIDLPDVHFGSPSNTRSENKDTDQDDKNLPASKDLIEVLGFNPDELAEDTKNIIDNDEVLIKAVKILNK